MHTLPSLALLSPLKVRPVPPNLRGDRTAWLGHMETVAVSDPEATPQALGTLIQPSQARKGSGL